MNPTLYRAGFRGVQQTVARRSYGSYKSRFGPKYTVEPNFKGVNFDKAINYGVVAAGLGAAAGTFAVLFFCDIPKVRNDIMKKIPLLGEYFVVEIPPEDNPF